MFFKSCLSEKENLLFIDYNHYRDMPGFYSLPGEGVA